MKFRINNPTDHVYFDDLKVEIPKLTVAKWKKLFQTVEDLPRLIVSVLEARARGTDDFVATVVVATTMAFDEIVKLVSVLTDIPAEEIENKADLNELIDFLKKTAEKNNLDEAAKKFQSVLARLNQTGGGEKTES